MIYTFHKVHYRFSETQDSSVCRLHLISTNNISTCVSRQYKNKHFVTHVQQQLLSENLTTNWDSWCCHGLVWFTGFKICISFMNYQCEQVSKQVSSLTPLRCVSYVYPARPSPAQPSWDTLFHLNSNTSELTLILTSLGANIFTSLSNLSPKPTTKTH